MFSFFKLFLSFFNGRAIQASSASALFYGFAHTECGINKLSKIARCTYSRYYTSFGEMAEWSNARASKACKPK
ncbi:MAG: hypothetical protein WCG06_04640, partial [Candidatus Omnitrophota bacterium]